MLWVRVSAAGVGFTEGVFTDRNCNPSLLGIIGLNSTAPAGQDHTAVQWWDAQGIVGLLLFLMCVLYSR